MASSSKSKKIYDVFLSFRGKDVRHNFVGHLYGALHRIGIYTFRDSEELKKGYNISMLMKAIEESCIAIIVFSENYASSEWCLTEMVKIVECKNQNNITILPVFYKVNPNEVRGGRKSYKIAMAKHESKFREDSEKVKKWKEALLDAGNLSGWHLNDRDDESKIIQEIVKEISTTQLGRTPLHVAEHPVGIDSKVVKLKSMLNLESKDDVFMVGLWGRGGIGKTTLGKAIYNNIFRQFEGSSFLANVRENSKDRNGLVTLQEKLLNDILLPKERLAVSTIDGGINLIQQRLGHKRVLVILDDVDHLNQLRALAGKINWFGNGSRILVTTRDSHLLTPWIDKYHVYEVKTLDNGEAHELLSKHAFSPHHKLKIREDLVDGVLDHAKGLPLALEVLGSFLCGRRQDEWESVLDNLSRIPKKDINDVLKISYDGLESNEKGIFLHIACFFKGWKFYHVKNVLDSCDFNAVIGLQILTERSLIRTISGYIEVHDLIQLMGKDIVNKESDDPERRSRLWLYEDVLEVLSRDILVSPFLANSDRLKYMNLSKCSSLVRMPDISCAPNLEELDLSCCKSLVEAHESIANHDKLQWLNLSFCFELRNLPKELKSKNLRSLCLFGCTKFERLPDIPHKLGTLRALNLGDTAIKELPASIENLVSLRNILLSGCKNLVRLPSSIYKLRKLRQMGVADCPNLIGFPKHENVADPCMKTVFPNLQELYIGRSYLCQVDVTEDLSRFPPSVTVF
ncbi:disease resistance protein RPV1-like [Rhodamnia argentea]|uniref:Disease resistance protein RPV1-like n=1 Tax=Rhodamnia argentea TaxID=178133 RepID=A0ABM3H4J7_9MYRT|nr:disease resistance protein RPV1-like [Rhodamnia argentea]